MGVIKNMINTKNFFHDNEKNLFTREWTEPTKLRRTGPTSQNATSVWEISLGKFLYGQITGEFFQDGTPCYYAQRNGNISGLMEGLHFKKFANARLYVEAD